ncbi:hypothetical protein NSERUTF1_0253 [Nocardia seriolae]|nr:hypothetical protein NSERUTF1_0253 [Nocardia seriolae]
MYRGCHCGHPAPGTVKRLLLRTVAPRGAALYGVSLWSSGEFPGRPGRDHVLAVRAHPQRSVPALRLRRHRVRRGGAAGGRGGAGHAYSGFADTRAGYSCKHCVSDLGGLRIHECSVRRSRPRHGDMGEGHRGRGRAAGRRSACRRAPVAAARLPERLGRPGIRYR